MCHNLTEIVLQNHSVPPTKVSNTYKIGVTTPPTREIPFYMKKKTEFCFFCVILFDKKRIMSYNT